jgi:hypothetical protein
VNKDTLINWLFPESNEFSPHSFLKICLLVAVSLSAVMALTSNYNRHPDEVHHFEAAKHYFDHWLPPEIGDPSVRDSYSVWGVSYLNYHWIEYLYAGKFAVLVSPLVSDEIIAVRLSSVCLFALLAFFFTYKGNKKNGLMILAAPLLITPQVWYIFSYANNDAFALFMSLISVYQTGIHESLFNRYLQSKDLSTEMKGGILAGLLLGLLLIVKTNYYVIIVICIGWLLSGSPVVNFPNLLKDRGLLKKSALIIAIGITVVGIRCGVDLYVNGETNFVLFSYLNYASGNFEKQQTRLMAYQEQIAETPYRPSTIENDLGNTAPSLKLKAKGLTYSRLFTEWRWHEISFKSFVGVYGYMNIFAPNFYYWLMAVLYASMALYLLIAVVHAPRPAIMVRIGILFIGSLVTIFISSYLSWTYAFQAQGRYLFPLIGMMGLGMYSLRQYVSNEMGNAFLVAAFLLSLYSFVFIGLSKINL